MDLEALTKYYDTKKLRVTDGVSVTQVFDSAQSRFERVQILNKKIEQYFASVIDRCYVGANGLEKSEKLINLLDLRSLPIEQESHIINQLVYAINLLLKKDGKKIEDIEKIEISSGGILQVFVVGKDTPLILDISAEKLEELLIRSKNIHISLKDLASEVGLKQISGLAGGITAIVGPQISEGGLYFLKGVRIPGIEGTIEVNGKFFQLSELEKSIIRQLEAQGIKYNPESNSFQRINKEIRLITLKNAIFRVSYEEYKENAKKGGLSDAELMSREEFESKKGALHEKIKMLHGEFIKSGQHPTLFGKFLGTNFNRLVEIGGKGLHYLLLPVFTQAMHKNPQDVGAVLESAHETIMFLAGAKVGGKIPGPVLLKMLSGIASGAIAVGVSKNSWNYILGGTDRNFTKYFPNREDFLEKMGAGNSRSIELHLLTSFGFYEFADLIGTDIGILNTNINFFQHTIDASTDPRIYLGLGIVRDREHRNKMLEKYQGEFKKEITKIFYTKSKGSLVLKTDGEIPTGNDLKTKIISIVAGKNPDELSEQHKEIVNRVVIYISQNRERIIKGEISLESILNLCLCELDKLNISIFSDREKLSQDTPKNPEEAFLEKVLNPTNDYLERYKQEIDVEKTLMEKALDGDTKSIYALSSSSTDLIYISQLPENERAFIREKLFKKILKKETLSFEKGNNSQPSFDEKTWEKLMGSNTFYIGTLDTQDKEFLVQSFMTRLGLPTSGEDEETKKLVLDFRNLIFGENNFIPLSTGHKYIQEFLSGILNRKNWVFNTAAKTPATKKPKLDKKYDFRPADGYFQIDEISNKIHGGNTFYTFFTRIIDMKRKEDFLKNMSKNGSPHKEVDAPILRAIGEGISSMDR